MNVYIILSYRIYITQPVLFCGFDFNIWLDCPHRSLFVPRKIQRNTFPGSQKNNRVITI